MSLPAAVICSLVLTDTSSVQDSSCTVREAYILSHPCIVALHVSCARALKKRTHDSVLEVSAHRQSYGRHVDTPILGNVV